MVCFPVRFQPFRRLFQNTSKFCLPIIRRGSPINQLRNMCTLNSSGRHNVPRPNVRIIPSARFHFEICNANAIIRCRCLKFARRNPNSTSTLLLSTKGISSAPSRRYIMSNERQTSRLVNFNNANYRFRFFLHNVQFSPTGVFNSNSHGRFILLRRRSSTNVRFTRIVILCESTIGTCFSNTSVVRTKSRLRR